MLNSLPETYIDEHGNTCFTLRHEEGFTFMESLQKESLYTNLEDIDQQAGEMCERASTQYSEQQNKIKQGDTTTQKIILAEERIQICKGIKDKVQFVRTVMDTLENVNPELYEVLNACIEIGSLTRDAEFKPFFNHVYASQNSIKNLDIGRDEHHKDTQEKYNRIHEILAERLYQYSELTKYELVCWFEDKNIWKTKGFKGKRPKHDRLMKIVNMNRVKNLQNLMSSRT